MPDTVVADLTEAAPERLGFSEMLAVFQRFGQKHRICSISSTVQFLRVERLTLLPEQNVSTRMPYRGLSINAKFRDHADRGGIHPAGLPICSR